MSSDTSSGALDRFAEWAKKKLCEGEIVVLETTTNVWETYDIVAPLVSRVLVANAAGVGEIVGARVKTNKEDIKRLLKLLFGGLVPEVWVPPAHVRELRAFISYRNRLVKMATITFCILSMASVARLDFSGSGSPIHSF